MILSYNWLLQYVPDSPEIIKQLEPEKLSAMLTSIGLEVENISKKGMMKENLTGLVVGEIVSCEKHPNADKLKVTSVNTGDNTVLTIVCGAANVAEGQKVVVAPIGSILHSFQGTEIEIKNARIRGVESQGMICAEDEIGFSDNHDGIIVLPADSVPGNPVSDYFNVSEDHIFEIGITPNRTDAMSHFGTARDVCAYLSHHFGISVQPVQPVMEENFPMKESPVKVFIEDPAKCMRYSGALISGITIRESPEWLKTKLQAIDVKPINNIVDITNFILHESGQPLHAFDADKIKGNTVIIKNAENNFLFKALDDKEKKLSSDDLVICNSTEPMCIAGVYGGIDSGVTLQTENVFLESAAFNPASIRKTSLSLNLRTDAALRFEKGTDVNNTFEILKRAVSLILSLAGGKAEGFTDLYPTPTPPIVVELRYEFLNNLSGKNYDVLQAKKILISLGFIITAENETGIKVQVPSFKNDILHPADLVDEIMRIDGLDNIPIPDTISISPSKNSLSTKFALKVKLENYLSGLCFEIFTNSITNSKMYDENTVSNSVKMINSLSADLDILRPEMLNSGLSAIAFNLNRRNNDLRFFEFGKTYLRKESGFLETDHLAIYITGNINDTDWKHAGEEASVFYIKGILQKLFEITSSTGIQFAPLESGDLIFSEGLNIMSGDDLIGCFGQVSATQLQKFGIKQPVFYADLLWENLPGAVKNEQFYEISRFPEVERDIAIVVDKNIPYEKIELTALKLKIANLTSMRLFDVYEGSNIAKGKKSIAINFTFADDKKTLTDVEIESMIQKLVHTYEKELNAEIRK